VSDTLSLAASARMLGVRVDALARVVPRGWLRTKRLPNGYHQVQWAALRRFAQDPRCWLLVAPERIVDGLLRAYALDARRKLGGGKWWRASELCRHYCISQQTLVEWRQRGWARGARLERYGNKWHLWAATPPPPPVDRRPIGAAIGRSGPIARAAEQRRRVVAAVLAAGGPPTPGSQTPFWEPLAAQLGQSEEACRHQWRRAVQLNEVPSLSGAHS
jgi:hypothetical protein